jgi:phosphoribosylcarboxyaminoimidazole (NCAIR) mutase
MSKEKTTSKPQPQVGVIMGSDTDLPVMSEAIKALKDFEIPCEVEVTSAHRSPQRTHEYATTAADRGLKVIIVGAGGASHLAGVVAAETTLPVIAVPVVTTPLAIIALSDARLAQRLRDHKDKLARSVAEKSARVKQQFEDT